MAKSALSKLEKPIEQIQDVMRYSDIVAVSIYKRRGWDHGNDKLRPTGKTYFGYDIRTDQWNDDDDVTEEE